MKGSPMKKSFIIKDRYDRVWGMVDVLGEEQGKTYGYLNATEEFNKVCHVFMDHNKAISDPQGNTEETGLKILELGAYLIDVASGIRIDISNIIFVNENLLVTFEITTDE
jgi:hypothetical protein